MAARLADHGGRKSPAVQKKNRLLAFGHPPFHRLAQGAGENATLWIISRGTPQISDPHDRHAFVIHPLVETHELVFPRLGVVPAFERWRCASQKDRSSFALSAQHGHVAGIVARGLVLFVGILVFLINDDDPGVFDRRKNRTPRANHNPGRAVVDFVPFVMALPFREVAVQHSDLVLHLGEAGLEALHRLRSEGDLRNEHQSGSAGIHRMADGAQVDFRFP